MKNKLIIDKLEELVNYYKTLKEPNIKFKIISLSKALKGIKEINYEINNTTITKLNDINGIGKGILSRITEILNTGTLEEIKDLDIKIDELDKLQRITGIGIKKAEQLLSNDITLDKLLKSDKYHDELTHHQIIGLKYYSDLLLKIPKKEIEKYETKLTKILTEFSDIKFQICGSYRREKPTSGDIDVLMTSKNKNDNLHKIIDLLSKKKLLIDHLTTGGDTKYMGVSRITPKAVARRIDIRFVTPEQYPYAILYFTGSRDFNRNMRQVAVNKGYKLNEYELLNIKTDENIIVSSEKEIFKKLDLEYVEPKLRI
tara:strand:- start:1000 stop:1941 length:942 start_codon:yes stop_codon:yes gene_type:complete